MDQVRLGIVGVGNMGSSHARRVLEGKIAGCTLRAVCDLQAERREAFGEGVEAFESSRKLIRSGLVDAVVVATPHYDHTTVGIDALKQGLHVLVEKPISVHKADCEKLIAAHKRRKQVFAAMFNQRTDPHYAKVKELIDRGELGGLMRVNWIVTNWFRTEYYYATGAWRATWAGEGGGVLLNQCPHQLDLLQWLCGRPVEVRAFCDLGKHHKIEVEDEVTAFLRYKNGATGVFIASTGESPGTNRLEITAERGRLLVEDDRIRFTRTVEPVPAFSRASRKAFNRPDVWQVEIPVKGYGGQHTEVLQNFVNAILHGEELIAPARDGIHSVELANAMLWSSLLGKPVSIPLDGKAFERRLKKLIRESTFAKETVQAQVETDMSESF